MAAASVGSASKLTQDSAVAQLVAPPGSAAHEMPPLTSDWAGGVALAIFLLAYALVVAEERLALRKSKPMVAAAGLIWGVIALRLSGTEAAADAVASAFRHVFLEFAELFFFLVVAMSYVAAIAERNVFDAMRSRLVAAGLGYRGIFWLTGVSAFFLSAALDNLTTALVMSGVILASAGGNRRFVNVAFVNLVVAANAGGAWSAFGDITTLMAWQAGKAQFADFLRLFLPSVVAWLIPALLMHRAIPLGGPAIVEDAVAIKPGGRAMCAALGFSIALTVAARQWLHLPAVFGMMMGLGLLQMLGYNLSRRDARTTDPASAYSVFRVIARAEWDTLLFFYGVLLSVGGLAAIGYLALGSEWLYGTQHFTAANVVLGLLSAIVDNIPIMYATLQMNPTMSQEQWLLVTLTTGIGGSLLAVGSAAGVALMGQSQGEYTFASHLRWTWAIALGYAGGIAMHLWWNGG